MSFAWGGLSLTAQCFRKNADTYLGIIRPAKVDIDLWENHPEWADRPKLNGADSPGLIVSHEWAIV
jgi:hypothetical protein